MADEITSLEEADVADDMVGLEEDAVDRSQLPLYSSIEQQVSAHRSDFVEMFSDTSFYTAVEAMLRFWRDLEPVYADNKVLRRLKPLVVRGRQDVEVSVYLLECGICALALDATRDLMEIEFLVRHFVHEPSAIEHWLVANEKARKDKFGANALRQAEAKRRRVDVKDLHDSTDYKGHSQALHVSLSPIVPRGILEDFGNDPRFQVMTTFEVLRHSQNTVREVWKLAREHDPEINDKVSSEQFDVVEDMTMRMKSALGAVGFPTSRM